ncbi:tetratricopeptide repeat protein [Oscillatoriales cyanobacterium LEGE 11467]|uniref:Tetratricopeptide repeat protein n=1 Tax=Zarconia navalis LEGE 11467 TaxID=1828826 RepID=A0A928VST3_9CYAN|nr:tetratricopeptide repeat protein [Zarconia navalis]MBE9039612.1 tetratricopeptide repeat protein [Zarconia navalis LEGE 11467]
MQHLGIPENKIIESDRHPHVRADRLLVPSLPSHFSWLSPESVKFLRQTFLPKINRLSETPERIYISRAKTRYRHLFNEAEVLELLKEYGFVSVYLEELSLDEQIHLFSQVKAVVAPHGSGLTNIIFCQPQTSVVEIVSPNYLRHYFGAISQLLHLNHYYLRGEIFTCYPMRQLMYPNSMTEDIQINLDTLRKILERIGIVKPIQPRPLEAFVVKPMQATLSAEQTAETLARKAETLLSQNQLEEAISACQKALEIAPKFAPTYKVFGNIWRSQQQIEKAREWYLKAIGCDPDYQEAYANLGNLAAGEKQWLEAIRWYTKAIEIDPGFVGAYDCLGKVWHQLGKDAEAIDCTYRAYEIEPNAFQPEEHLELGDRLFDRGQLTQAITCYRQALELAPQMQSVYERLSRALGKQGKSEEAAIYARQGMRLSLEEAAGNPTNGDRPGLENKPEKIAASRQQAAEALLFQGKLDEATQAGEEALHIDPNFVPTFKTLGNIARSRGDIEKAREWYLKAIEIDPAYAEAYANLGNLAAQAKQWPEAIERYQKAIALKPDFAGAYDRLSKVLQQLGKEREAAECAFCACELNPSSVGVEQYLKLGNILFRYKQLDRAVFCYRQALELNPKLFAACQNLAEALTQQGKSDEAARYYRQAMQLYMNQPQEKNDRATTLTIDSPAPSTEHQSRVKAALQEAQKHYNRKEWPLAIDACKRALDIQPGAAEAHAILGNIACTQGDCEEARQAYNRAIALKPELAYVRANLGSICAELNQPEDAIAHYQAALQIDPKFTLVYRNWGQLYQKLDRWAEAADCYRKAIELEPEFVPTYQKLAVALIAAEDWQGARDTYQKAIELKSNAAWAHCGLGDALAELGEWEDAASAYRRAIELDPELAGLSEKLGDLFQKRLEYYSQQALESYHQAARANPDQIELYHKILEITPNDVNVHLQLVRALERQGNWDEAIVFSQMALQIQPDAVEAHIELGKVLAQQSQLTDATVCYRRAIELAPNVSVAHHHLGEVLSLQGQSEQAIASFRRALEIDSEFYQKIQVGIEEAKVYFELAKMFERQNDSDRAISCYHRATQLDPGQCWYYHHLADALVKKDYKSERSIEFYRRAIETNPTPSFWHYQNLGVVLFNREDFSQAKESFQKAISIDSSFSWSHKKLGDILVFENNVREASIYYRQAVRLQPKLSI